MTSSLLAVVYFWVCAAFAVAGALATVVSRNPIRGAMGLLLSIGAMAALFLSLSAEFLAAVQLLVYAGAVVVLFLFVIMLLGPAAEPAHDNRALGSRVFAALGTLLVAGAGIGSILFWNGTGKVNAFPPLQGGEGSIEAMSREVFSTGIVPFEIASVLLLVAVVGAVAVARGRQGDAPRIAVPPEGSNLPRTLADAGNSAVARERIAPPVTSSGA